MLCSLWELHGVARLHLGIAVSDKAFWAAAAAVDEGQAAAHTFLSSAVASLPLRRRRIPSPAVMPLSSCEKQ